jgi:erythromycin esterase-like protein
MCLSAYQNKVFFASNFSGAARYVRGVSDDTESVEALGNFKRFPTWMWRNADVLDFVGWLRDYNDARASGATPVGLYGLDLYSLHTSITAVLGYLDKVDPEAARRARYRYGCLEHFGEDTQAYGYAASIGLSKSCEDAVVSQLLELQRHAAEYAGRDGRVTPDEFFYAEQNARLVKNAEEYYRAMFRGRVSSWNLRDYHMAETLAALATSLQGQGQPAKIVVWAYNSHLGDARATEMGEAGELNVGQLVREQYGKNAVLIGFSTSRGTVTAATEWDGPAERKRVRPALPDSYEALFHELDLGRFLISLRDGGTAITRLRRPRLERAIGVLYRPETERLSHYFSARLPEQVVYLPTADKYRRLTRLPPTGAKRSRRGGSHGLPAALSPLVTPSTPAVWTHVACSGHLPVPFPTPWLAHTPAGWGHGGTRNSSTSRSVHT